MPFEGFSRLLKAFDSHLNHFKPCAEVEKLPEKLPLGASRGLPFSQAGLALPSEACAGGGHHGAPSGGR